MAALFQDSRHLRNIIEWCTKLFKGWRLTEWVDYQGGWVRGVI